MKLEKILENLNSFEKNSFLKIIDNIIAKQPQNYTEIEKILSDKTRDLKNMDNINISKVFNLVQDEFSTYIRSEFADSKSQLDILTDLISREGKCILKLDWFSRLYEKEITSFKIKLKHFEDSINNEKSEIEENRKRDYLIYQSCLNTAFCNDEQNNQDKKITREEQAILQTLATNLGLSQEEIKLINYLIIPIIKHEVDTIINDLKAAGVIFYSKKTNTIYVADEIVKILRRTRGKLISDKYFRRILNLLREPQLNLVCKKHSLDWRQPYEQKVKDIINAGISFSEVLLNDIQKDKMTLTEKKLFLNEFCDKELNISPSLKGSTIDDKIKNLIKYFDDLEQDDRIGISFEGYEKMLLDLDESLPHLKEELRSEMEFQETNILNATHMMAFNLKPRDILELISKSDLNKLATKKDIKIRGDVINNILESYKDSANLFLENYTNIGFRNLAALKENGISIKEGDLGVKFEELTKNIFEQLGFNVDEDLRRKINTEKDKIDILINIGNNEIILVECKTNKESGYNKFSSVPRQLKSYSTLLSRNNFKVVKSILIAPEFTVDFIKDCGLDYELNLSLISAPSLIKILTGFKNSKLKTFPHNLLMRDVLIHEDRVLASIER